MRKVALFVGPVLGAGVGLLTSLTDGIGLKIVMMLIGAVAGAAIGGAISRIGRKRNHESPVQRDSIPGVGFSSEDPMKNYWLDRGEIYPMPGHPDPEGARRDHP